MLVYSKWPVNVFIAQVCKDSSFSTLTMTTTKKRKGKEFPLCSPANCSECKEQQSVNLRCLYMYQASNRIYFQRAAKNAQFSSHSLPSLLLPYHHLPHGEISGRRWLKIPKWKNKKSARGIFSFLEGKITHITRRKKAYQSPLLRGYVRKNQPFPLVSCPVHQILFSMWNVSLKQADRKQYNQSNLCWAQKSHQSWSLVPKNVAETLSKVMVTV